MAEGSVSALRPLQSTIHPDPPDTGFQAPKAPGLLSPSFLWASGSSHLFCIPSAVGEGWDMVASPLGTFQNYVSKKKWVEKKSLIRGAPSAACLERERTEKSVRLTVLSLLRGVPHPTPAVGGREVWKAFRISNSGNTALSPGGGHTWRLCAEKHAHTSTCKQKEISVQSIFQHDSSAWQILQNLGLAGSGCGVFGWV